MISEDENFRRIFHIIQWEMEDEIELAATLLRKIVSDQNVQEMISDNDREGLLKYLLPEYEFFRHKIYRYHIHSSNGISLLRVHHPELRNDDLTKIRPMITRMIEQKEELRGIEKGREGFSMRVMMPVFMNDRFIGSIEYGMDFQGFLERITERYCGNFFIFELHNNNTFSLFSSPEEVPLYVPGFDEVAKIRDGTQSWVVPSGRDFSVGILPFKDFEGNVAGFFQVELCRSSIIQKISDMLRTFIILIFLLTVVFTGLLFLYIQLFLIKPLRSVVDQTKAISREITSGNLSFRGDVDETGVDFKEIISAVNKIIANLREREILLKAIVDGFPGIVFYLDRDSRVLWANARAKTIGDGEIIGMQLIEALSLRGFFDGEKELLEETIRHKKTASRSACYMRNTGNSLINECWEHLSIPIFDEKNDISNILRISSDITEKTEAEAKLKQMNETLEKRVENEVEKRKEQEEMAYNQSRLASIGELAAGIAHEINQPLNSISFSLENIYKKYLNGSIEMDYFKKKIKDISGDISRTRRIIDHVRLFAGESSGEYNMLFSIDQCIHNAMSMVNVQMATHGIDVDLQLDEDLPTIYGNPFRYEQVVLNLISNARDALEERRKKDTNLNNTDTSPLLISISTRVENGSILLEVTDNGSGIDAKILNRVFDPFFTTKPFGKGTGLGLSITYGIIQEFDGTIEIIPQVQGTRVRVSVPSEDKL